MSYVRSASHAGLNGSGWYEAAPEKLKIIIDEFFAKASNSGAQASSSSLPCAIISPHAGIRFSGQTAAAAFWALRRRLAGGDRDGSKEEVERVFILGPSHTKGFHGVEISAASAYATPFGEVPVDTNITKKLLEALRGGGVPAGWATQRTDEAEHSLEMQMPFLSHILHYPLQHQKKKASRPISIVPVIVGWTDRELEGKIATVMKPYMEDSRNFFVFSSDFCHWGSQFRYHFHYEKEKYPKIGDAIIAMDHAGANLLQAQDIKGWYRYLDETENTICGRNPIGVGLHWWSDTSTGAKVEFVDYSQSNKCQTSRDCSVSYASFIISR